MKLRKISSLLLSIRRKSKLNFKRNLTEHKKHKNENITVHTKKYKHN